jgi:hypothetical protein
MHVRIGSLKRQAPEQAMGRAGRRSLKSPASKWFDVQWAVAWTTRNLWREKQVTTFVAEVRKMQ